jgi:MerR family transcriptional regulator, light-induced transcriptional regulator
MDPANASGVRTVLLAALIDGDLGVAYQISTGLLEDGVPFEVLVAEVLGPIQTEIGRRWADGDLTIADEHASTAATESLVALLSGVLAPPDGPTVVIACPENDNHSLPGRVVAATLAVRGFRAMFLGASLPADDLGEYLEHQQPMALALSISMGSALFGAAHSIAVAHTHGVPVLVGGQAIGHAADRAGALGADGFALDATEAAELLDRWIVLPPDPLAPDAPIHSECALIARIGPQLVATTLDEVGVSSSATPRLADELARVLHVIQGALTLDEPAILAEHVAALRSSDRAHGLEPDLVDAAVSGLADAMNGSLPAARGLLNGLAA